MNSWGRRQRQTVPTPATRYRHCRWKSLLDTVRSTAARGHPLSQRQVRSQNTNFDDSKWMKLNLLEKWETKKNELKIETIDFCNLNFIRMKNIWKNGTRKLIKATSFFPPFETNFLTELNARWPELFRIVHLNPWAFYLNLCFFFILLRVFLFRFVRWAR